MIPPYHHPSNSHSNESYDVYDGDDEYHGIFGPDSPPAFSSAFAQGLNDEMDVIEAAVMGAENVANLSHAYMGNHMATNDDDLSDSGSNVDFPLMDPWATDVSTFVSHFSQPLSSYGNANLAELYTAPSQVFPAVSQLAQQLQQHLETAQIQGNILGQGTHVGPQNMQDLNNQNLADFLYRWAIQSGQERRMSLGPNTLALHKQRDRVISHVNYYELNGERYDLQGINWAELGVTRQEARRRRRETYKNYRNIKAEPLQTPHIELADDESYYRFRRMDLRHNIHLSHFQLRNLMASTSSGNIFYAGEYKVYNHNALFGTTNVIMDLTDPVVQPPQSPFSGVQISTVAADSNVLIAGGFYGEYGMMGLNSSQKGHVEGLVTLDQNSITNHIEVHLSRNSGLPQAVFASNDSHVRILDCTTNRFSAEHRYDFAVNCTAKSPDQRLHCVVGDARHVTITNAETGQIYQELEGHRDFGFACAWSDNGWHVATGNQDMLVKVWDARKWTNSHGRAEPISTINMEMAGARSLRFSPSGSGAPLLVIAEPADVVSVVEAQLFQSKQTLEFFGEVGGIGFGSNGHDLFVANCDEMRGGIIQYENCSSSSEVASDMSYQDESDLEAWEYQSPPKRSAPYQRGRGGRHFASKLREESDVVGLF